MRPLRTNAPLLVLLILLVAGLGVLATLQYRWIDQVTAAEAIRMRANLDFAARRMTGELVAQIDDLHQTLTGPPPGVENVLSHYYEWQQRAQHPALVEAIYVVEPFAGSFHVQQLDESGNLVEIKMPPELEPVRRRIASGREGAQGGPLIGEIPALILPPRRGPFDGAQGRPEGRALFEPPPFEEQNDRRAVLVTLSRHELANVILPELTRRHFGDSAYDVALLSRAGVLYSTSNAWPKPADVPDLEIPIAFGGRRGPPEGPRLGPDDRPFDSAQGRPPREQGPGPAWRLLVRRRDGGLDQLVRAARHRNLAISFGILVILVATVLLLLYLLQRADRLRTQQTEFVAAISHELNTPVAALRSAGENLKDGIITDREKLAKYGETIVREASRLGDMIAQVLEFAGMQARRQKNPDQPIDVASVIEEAVAQCRWLVDGTAVQVETRVASDLPRPNGDPRALTRAVQNLVANAIRHGGSGGWIGIRASRNGANRIRISVEDRGPGIDSRDASHLFEPFYRGRRAGHVRGSGLGLTIVKQIVTAHGGTIEIERRRKTGAAFIIHLPVEEHG